MKLLRIESIFIILSNVIINYNLRLLQDVQKIGHFVIYECREE